MTILMRIIRWLWRAWPALVMVVVYLLHRALLEIFPSELQLINETLPQVLQVFGGLLVLYSIDSNIGIIKGLSLAEEFRRYLCDFPLIKKSNFLDVHDSVFPHTSGKSRLSDGRNPRTIEERLDYLQEQINETRRNLQEDISDLESRFTKRTKSIDERIDALGASMTQIETKVEKVSVGGIKIQVLGVSLVIYGAFVG